MRMGVARVAVSTSRADFSEMIACSQVEFVAANGAEVKTNGLPNRLALSMRSVPGPGRSKPIAPARQGSSIVRGVLFMEGDCAFVHPKGG